MVLRANKYLDFMAKILQLGPDVIILTDVNLDVTKITTELRRLFQIIIIYLSNLCFLCFF